jgi:ketosteroid isomerase-like protein
MLICVPLSAQNGGKRAKEFNAFLAKLDSAQEQFHNGRPSVLEELWSHQDDVTLAGGTGGPIEKGWANVKKRLDTVTAHYADGKQTNERVDVAVIGDFASVVQYEHIVYTIPGNSAPSKRDYRITMIFRHEKQGWRLVHRQADTQTEMKIPK